MVRAVSGSILSAGERKHSMSHLAFQRAVLLCARVSNAEEKPGEHTSSLRIMSKEKDLLTRRSP